MASSPLSSNAPITSASTLPVEGNKTTQSVLNKVEPVKMEQSACCKAPDMKVASSRGEILEKAVNTASDIQTIGGHGAKAFALPVTLASAYTAFQAYSALNRMMNSSDENYSMVKDGANTALHTMKVNTAIVMLGFIPAHLLTTHYVIPGAEKTYQALPADLRAALERLATTGKDVAVYTGSKAVEGGIAAGRGLFNFAKTAHITVPEWMVKGGMVLGSGTDAGSDAVVKTQNAYSNDVRLQAAQSRNADVKPA